VNMDRFSDRPSLDIREPREDLREREDDAKVSSAPFRDHADEIESAIRWRKEQCEKRISLEQLAANRAAKMVELALKNHHLELMVRDCSEWLHDAAQCEPDAKRRLDLQLRAQRAQKCADQNQIL